MPLVGPAQNRYGKSHGRLSKASGIGDILDIQFSGSERFLKIGLLGNIKALGGPVCGDQDPPGLGMDDHQFPVGAVVIQIALHEGPDNVQNAIFGHVPRFRLDHLFQIPNLQIFGNGQDIPDTLRKPLLELFDLELPDRGELIAFPHLDGRDALFGNQGAHRQQGDQSHHQEPENQAAADRFELPSNAHIHLLR